MEVTIFIPAGTRSGMSTDKPAWTTPGPIDQAALDAESRKGTAADHPVLSLSPAGEHAPGRRDAVATGEVDTGHDHRSPAEIEADINETRYRLAETLDELSERLSPRAALRKANTSVRGAFVGPDGAVRKDRAALVAGAVLAAVGGLLALRGMRSRPAVQPARSARVRSATMRPRADGRAHRARRRCGR
jgi:hypothetical protein